MIAAEHSALGPGGRSGVKEGCLDVADQSQDHRPGVRADAMSITGLLDDRNFADQHPDRMLDRDGVQGRVVGVEDNHRRHSPHLPSWPKGAQPTTTLYWDYGGLGQD